MSLRIRGHRSASRCSPHYCYYETVQAYLDMALHRLAWSNINAGSESTDHFQLMQVWFSAASWYTTWLPEYHVASCLHVTASRGTLAMQHGTCTDLHNQSAALNHLCYNKSLHICSTALFEPDHRNASACAITSLSQDCNKPTFQVAHADIIHHAAASSHTCVQAPCCQARTYILLNTCLEACSRQAWQQVYLCCIVGSAPKIDAHEYLQVEEFAIMPKRYAA